jgi:hypothetical protein
MKFIIVQDSRKNIGMNIALIARDKVTVQGRWWTSLLENALTFDSKEEADKVCSKYKFNNPRVIPFDEAKLIIHPIVTIKYSFETKSKARSIFDMNDYEYKEWLGGGNDGWSEFDGGSGQVH